MDASAAVAPEEAAVSFDAHPIETGAIAAYHVHAACRVVAACPPRGGQTRLFAFSLSLQISAHSTETGAIAAYHVDAACRVVAACPPCGGQTRPLAFSFSLQISEHPTDARWRPHADARFEGCRFWC